MSVHDDYFKQSSSTEHFVSWEKLQFSLFNVYLATVLLSVPNFTADAAQICGKFWDTQYEEETELRIRVGFTRNQIHFSKKTGLDL